MDCHEYLCILSERYKRYFDVHKDYDLLGSRLDLFAEYKVKNERYFLTKSAVVYSFENFEYCLVKCLKDQLSLSDFEQFTNYLVEAVKKSVKPSTQHMSTYLSGVIVCEEGFSPEVIKRAEEFKYSKDFLFTLKGWCDVRLILVDLKGNEIITNKKGREVKKNYIIDR